MIDEARSAGAQGYVVKSHASCELLPAIQAELWREAGDVDRAIECYRAALGLARSAPEQRWLTSRLSLLV